MQALFYMKKRTGSPKSGNFYVFFTPCTDFIYPLRYLLCYIHPHYFYASDVDCGDIFRRKGWIDQHKNTDVSASVLL